MDSKVTPVIKESYRDIFRSLQNFKSDLPIICKDTKGYGYNYADLPKIISVITPLLKKHGLDYFQTEERGYMKTIVIHVESGETLESKVSIPEGVQLKGMNDFQTRGSALTYFRRYSLSLALGLVTDKDTDAHGEQVSPKNTETPPKPELTADCPAYQKILSLVGSGETEGITLEKIKKKYLVSPEVEKYLESNNIF